MDNGCGNSLGREGGAWQRDPRDNQAEVDALRRDMADTMKRLAKAEASIERMIAAMPRKSTPEQLINQTYKRETMTPIAWNGPVNADGTPAPIQSFSVSYTEADPLGR